MSALQPTSPDPAVTALLIQVSILTRQVRNLREQIAALTGGLTPDDVESSLSDLERRIEELESGDRGES